MSYIYADPHNYADPHIVNTYTDPHIMLCN